HIGDCCGLPTADDGRDLAAMLGKTLVEGRQEVSDLDAIKWWHLKRGSPGFNERVGRAQFAFAPPVPTFCSLRHGRLLLVAPCYAGSRRLCRGMAGWNPSSGGAGWAAQMAGEAKTRRDHPAPTIALLGGGWRLVRRTPRPETPRGSVGCLRAHELA